MSKKNIGATLALYPSPLIVAGAMVDGNLPGRWSPTRAPWPTAI